MVARWHLARATSSYTSDSLWKIWFEESIQSIHNSLWTWHDKCNICCRYCSYHVKFNVCLVTKPLGVSSSETKWLNASLLFLRMNWRASCKKGVYRILADFHFFAGSSWFLADWLVLTWKASFRNFFCRLALRSPEITYAKRLSFAWSGILMSESFEGRFRLLLAALTACFL